MAEDVTQLLVQRGQGLSRDPQARPIFVLPLTRRLLAERHSLVHEKFTWAWWITRVTGTGSSEAAFTRHDQAALDFGAALAVAIIGPLLSTPLMETARTRFGSKYQDGNLQSPNRY